MTDYKRLKIARAVLINRKITMILLVHFAHWVTAVVKCKTANLSEEEVNQQLHFSFSKHVFLVFGYACSYHFKGVID